MLSDFKYALRQMRKSPGFTMIAVLTLALGIGACTAVFSVVNTTILHPFSYPRLDRLAVIHEVSFPLNPRDGVSPGAFFEIQRQATVFTSLAAARMKPHNLSAKEVDPVRVYTEHVSANFFSTLGVEPMLGRDFRPNEMIPGRGNVAILSHGLWLSEFGGRPDVMGETVLLDDQETTLIGVMPANFQSDPAAPNLYAPLILPAQSRLVHDWHPLFVIGRLKDHVSVAQADTELRLIAHRLAQQYPETNRGWSATVTSLLDDTVDFARPLLFTLMGAVALLLLIACVNTANLLLVRATSRQKEIMIRTALGATGAQIMRQLLCESLLLAGLGGTVGVLLAHWSLHLMISISPVGLPRINDIAIDTDALAFSCALVLLTGLGFGLAPAFQAMKVNLHDVLKDSGRGASAGRGGRRLRHLLVVSEVALAFVLLVGAGLFTRSFLNFQNVDFGYRQKDLYFAPVILSQRKHPDDQNRASFASQVMDRIRSVHGVAAASLTSRYMTGSDGAPFIIAGQRDVGSNTRFYAFQTSITPDYLRTLVIPLIRGRAFTARDVAGTVPVVLVNRELARRYFPGKNPIGEHLGFSIDNSTPVIFREIVGVIGTIQDPGIDTQIRPEIYLPFAQTPYSELNLYVRADPGTPLDIRGVCAAIHSLDNDVPISMLWPMGRNERGLPAVRRFSMALSVVFSTIALLLAAIGIYGVIAFNVAQLTGEIGIRMALGAQRADVLKLVLWSGGRMVALGLLLGVAGALAAGRFLGSLLYNLSAFDPLTLGGITLGLALVALLACWVPARRATRVDPMVALRTE